MNDKEIIRQFKNYLENERAYSYHTVINYLFDINEFNNYLKTNEFGKLDDVRINIPRYYLSYLNKKGYMTRSIARKMSSLRSFYAYLLKMNIIEVNFFAVV